MRECVNTRINQWSARRCVPCRGAGLPSVCSPVQNSSGFGRCRTGSRVHGDEPLRCVRHIADSRRGYQLSRDAHVSTIVPPLANSWPTARTVQYVARNGSSFGLQRYYFSSIYQSLFSSEATFQQHNIFLSAALFFYSLRLYGCLRGIHSDIFSFCV